ncbi:unnamed protein product [Hyaloperonospora brassicae]|uniref:Telomere-associated protein Rif1 N-terminal domain-containing protein n=1 Tax=Hyaloperonospora brassicae TaxID=162125 RepID=A0AAV0UCB0_HYABA|nr:unnamed protein product [Hyaloperonospora brassicae]
MGRADDPDHDPNEAPRRRSRARPRPAASASASSASSAYVPTDAADTSRSRAPRSSSSSKMKMASLMAVVDDQEESEKDVARKPHGVSAHKSKRVKVHATRDDWTARHEPISIQSLTRSDDGGGAGESSPGRTRSLFDYYFPLAKTDGGSAPGSSSSSNLHARGPGTRTLKRKRRGGRRTEDFFAATELDGLKFGVDAGKLVPQGLVDRVDAQLSRAVLVKVVGNHVTNWCYRSGFASSFLQELTTLLAAYYPCTYPTLLDEVLAGFLLKRPEFIDLLLPAMLEKMSKVGGSISASKYPVADALVRICSVSMGPVWRHRHDLVCRSLLRCLLEHNADRFVLSPWIAACAIECSDSVLHTMWRALLRSHLVAENIALRDEDAVEWRIQDPAQQLVELLAEEGKLRVCRITCGFVKLLLADNGLKELLVESRSYLIRDCVERAFKYAGTDWSSSLMAGWLERRRKLQLDEAGKDGSFKELVDFLVCSTMKLSVKKPEWFVKHVLSFVLSPQCHAAEQEPALRAILRDYTPFVFGGVDSQWLEQTSKHSGSSGSLATPCVATKDLDAVGSQSVQLARSKMELTIGLLVSVDARTSALFLDIWSTAWTDKRTALSWGYVHALLCVTIQDTAGSQSELGQKLQNLTIQVCQSHFRHLSRVFVQDDAHDDVAVKFSEALNLLFPSTHHIADALLQEVLGAFASLEGTYALDASTIVGNAISLYLGSCGDGGANISVKRSAVVKPLAEHGRCADSSTSRNTSATTMHLLTMLKTLASATSDAGEFARRVLSSGRVVRLLAALLNLGRRRQRQETILDVMNAAVMSDTLAKSSRDWARLNVTQEIMRCAYMGPATLATKAIAVLQNLFRRCTSGMQALLWAVLQQCTKLWCGRGEDMNGDEADFSSDNYYGRADTFAELVKAVVITLPVCLVRDVLRYMEQKLASCSSGKTRMNLFLLLLLRKLVVCKLGCGMLLPAMQLAVCPLAPTSLDPIRLTQLQLIKALCTRLLAVRHRAMTSENSSVDADWMRYENLVCNERLQSELRSMVKVALPATDSAPFKAKRITCSRASEVLAQNILAFTRQLRQPERPLDNDGRRMIRKKSRLI